jgi:hypothetical protein
MGQHAFKPIILRVLDRLLFDLWELDDPRFAQPTRRRE